MATGTELSEAIASLPTPSPFIKWAGGKSRLLSQYDEHFPVEFDNYHEPFVGGGAVFFHLAPATATLSDINPRLVEVYRTIRDDVEALIDRLAHHRERHNKAYYYQSRTRFNGGRMNAVDRASLFIYLNKTCFNGLYRENSRGEFNVPMGRYKSPSIFDPMHLRSVSLQLQDVDLVVDGFMSVADRAEPGDLVYFDPPYVPLNRTSSFTTYSKGGFDEKMQHDLARTFDKLAKRGCFVMLSNSDCPFVRELYAGWRVETISAPRAINSKAGRRGRVNEVLVCSW